MTEFGTGVGARLRGVTGFLTRSSWSSAVAAGALLAVLGSGQLPRRVELAEPMADSTDQVVLSVVEAVVEAATHAPEPWPGYNAAERPFLVYRVGRWSVLLNPPSPDPSEGWLPYPSTWPPLSRPAWFDPDGDPGLVGQLEFDYEVPGAQVVAVPLYEDLPPEYGQRELYLYSFIAHEAFHQFQRHCFSDIDTPSEEQYPMLDPVNNALAALELRALKESMQALGQSDSARAREGGSAGTSGLPSSVGPAGRRRPRD